MHLTRYHSSSLSIFFFFNDAATSEFYTLSLHDALPILRKKARTLGQHINRSGNWRVTLGPSETRGEWDLGIRAAAGWHVVSFTAPVEQLPDIVDRTLRERLVLLVSDASAAGWW